MGILYRLGEGVPKDYTEAVRWFRLAAEQGDVTAQRQLGDAYRFGEGVSQDYVQAYAWLNIAAARGEDAAAENRDEIAELMTHPQIEEAQRMSQDLWNRIEAARGP